MDGKYDFKMKLSIGGGSLVFLMELSLTQEWQQITEIKILNAQFWTKAGVQHWAVKNK